MKKQDNAIHFIITGGTIDSYYESTKDTVVPLKRSVIPPYLKSLKMDASLVFTQACMKDSRALTEDDRKNVLKEVEKSPHSRIIITHGTYTMPDTARYLKAQLKRTDQTIVLTGSMVPLTGFAPSDASFNLGYAIARVQDLSPGIYVAMNGQIFAPDEVVKLLSIGKFGSIFGETGKSGN